MSADGKPHLYIDMDGDEFRVLTYERYAHLTKQACSDKCVRMACEAWLADRAREKEMEATREIAVKELVLVGGQPA